MSPEQVVYLLCRFIFFPRNARTKPVLLQLHLFVSFKLQVFRELIVFSGVWGGAQAIPMNVGSRH